MARARRRGWSRAAIVALAGAAAVAAASCAHLSPEAAQEYYRQGAEMERQNRPWEAIVAYRRVLQAEPGNDEVRLRLADLLFETGDIPGAERSYKTVLHHDPDNSQAINNLCWLYTHTGYHLDWAEKAMQPLVGRESPHRHVYLDTLGMVLFKRRKYGEAAAALQEAVDLCRKGPVLSTGDECLDIERHLAEAGRRR